MKEQSLFDFPQVRIDKPIRLIEAFGGIGSQAMALRNIGADFEHYRKFMQKQTRLTLTAGLPF